MNNEPLFKSIDDWIWRHPLHSGRGWHNNHKPGEAYNPAIQQAESEFKEFLTLVRSMGLKNKALEIGLGMFGGTHFSFTQIFRKTVTVELSAELIGRYASYNPVNSERETFILGDSCTPTTLARAKAEAPYDLLFIDGDHSLEGARRDWQNYKELVRKGGLIAFHDSVPRPHNGAEFGVDKLLDQLKSDGTDIRQIGTQLGIACYVV